MKVKARIYFIFSIVIMVLLCHFTDIYMNILAFELDPGSSLSYTIFSITAISFIAVVSSKRIYASNFCVFWIIWLIWMFLEVVIFRLSRMGVSTFFYVSLAPLVFLFSFCAKSQIDKIEVVFLLGFLFLYGFSFYLNIKNLVFLQVDIGEDTSISNLVYWPLCVMPFFFLIPQKWIQSVLLASTIVIVLLTAKRSATICIVAISFSYVLFLLRDNKNKIGAFLLVLVASVVIIYLISHYFLGSFMGILDRMATIRASQGSGRIPLYKDVFGVLAENSILDWLVGRGAGSIVITKHTNAHNDALQMLFEFGLVGLILYIILVLKVIRRMVFLRKATSRYYMGYLVSVIIVIVIGAVSNLVVFYSYFSFICIYWGLAETEISKIKKMKNLKWTPK